MKRIRNKKRLIFLIIIIIFINLLFDRKDVGAQTIDTYDSQIVVIDDTIDQLNDVSDMTDINIESVVELLQDIKLILQCIMLLIAILFIVSIIRNILKRK